MIGIYEIVTVFFAGCVLLGIKMMSSPKTAVKGNLLGGGSILAALIFVLVYNKIISMPMLWLAMAIGGSIGYYFSQKVTMLQLPQMVATFNGMGGGAAALIAIVKINESFYDMGWFYLFTSLIALLIGCLTFSGSIVAALKLDNRISQKPVMLPAHSMLSIVLGIGLVLFAVLGSMPTLFTGGAPVNFSVYFAVVLVMVVVALAYGVLLSIRVGGADMPITISLLISFSGIAGSVVGLAIANVLLVAVAAIVGASGIILTNIMCKAMNRSLLEILSGKTTVSESKSKPKPSEAPKKQETAVVAEKPAVVDPKKGAARLLDQAKKVIIVPGYGMALSQAQSVVKQLSDLLESKGKEVSYAIHPVAGRMPGHMNVLLAEVDVDYDKLLEMEQINPEFPDTDVVLVIGANDVINPAALTAEGTPIYGMPILEAYKAKNVIVCNFDAKPGYAGVDNELYTKENTHMVLGDAKETISALLSFLQGQELCDEPTDIEKAGKTADARAEKDLLLNAKKVIIVPGYGMALAQSQSEVKQLADLLEGMGKEVSFAIHPVAGRMPGHMNVLLAEVDVDYDKLLEMEQINPEFPDTDVVLVIGANDVINPAALTAEGTPIYGMPILEAYKAKNIIICNYDEKPGYAGVDNELYEKDNVNMLLGDAKDTVGKLLALLQGQDSCDAQQSSGSEATSGSGLSEKKILAEAKKIIIVPGYGMALAQSQSEVKQLADLLESKGKEVSFAIHPVAGRMPGHMNVLLAEVDVDYDKLLEMEQINPEFPDTDVVLVIGANDVVNPAALTAVGTPIYGMPILEAYKAKHVIICNYDEKPGYAGVDNELYEKDNVLMLLGDAKDTVAKLLEVVRSF